MGEQMYRGCRIALVIPAFNESKLIRHTLSAVPELVDIVYVVDDASSDNQAEVVRSCSMVDSRIVLIRHERNKGPGAAIITGYARSSGDENDITVVVGGDHQMDLSEIRNFLDPIVDEEADYTKGNRFLIGKFRDTVSRMPRIRLLGNWIITALTKIASGYFKVMDVVDGYTAISKEAIDIIDWSKAWKGYGYPMDFLVRLNAYGLAVLDVPRTAIYLTGERQSQIKGFRYARRVSRMLLKAFFWRLHFKYVYLDFHPLIFFYYLSFICIPSGVLLGGYLIVDKLFAGGYYVTAPKAILVALILIAGFQSLLFAMLFDRGESRWTYPRASARSRRTSSAKTIPVTASSTL